MRRHMRSTYIAELTRRRTVEIYAKQSTIVKEQLAFVRWYFDELQLI